MKKYTAEQAINKLGGHKMKKPNREEAMDNLKKAIEAYAVIPFTEDHVKNSPADQREVEGLGIAISNWADYDCLKILEVMYGALEDSNFHSFNESVKVEIDKLKARNREARKAKRTPQVEALPGMTPLGIKEAK